MYKFLNVHIQQLNFWVNIYHYFLDIFYKSKILCMVARLFVIYLNIFGHMFYIFLNINIKTIFLFFHTCKRLGDMFDIHLKHEFFVI